MRFIKIEIKNFRQYKYLELDFKKNTEHDLHVVMGDNGIGKTNILNAISWCLYNKEYHLADDSKALSIMNIHAEKEAKANNQEKESVYVKIHAEEKGNPISFHREEVYKVDTKFALESNFIVENTQNEGTTLILQEDEAISFVNKYLPERIREYIFFDGEKLTDYFFENQATNIKDSVHAISRVDMISRIRDRLNNTINNMEREASKLNPNINDIVKERDELFKIIKEKEEDIAEIKEQIHISKNKTDSTSINLRGYENLPKQEKDYHEQQARLEKLKNTKFDISKNLNEFIKKFTIILGFYPSIKKTLEIIKETKSNKTEPEFYDKTLLQKMLDDNECFFCEKELTTKDREKTNNLLKHLKFSTKTYLTLTSIESDLMRYKSKATGYIIEKDKILNRIRDNESEIKKSEKIISELEFELSKYPNTAQIHLWYDEKKKHSRLIETNNQKLGAFSKDLESKQKELEKKEKELTIAMSKEKTLKNINAQIDLARKACKIANEIEREMTEDVRKKIEVETKNYFNNLIWKKNTFKDVLLSENYVIDLIHYTGESCVGSVSAAEKSLLALSFTLALHKVSNFNSLLFIDTPVARVTGENRSNFANVLNTVSKDKQIIMTFTPDEYSNNIRQVFASTMSNFVKLTTVNEDYTIKAKE